MEFEKSSNGQFKGLSMIIATVTSNAMPYVNIGLSLITVYASLPIEADLGFSFIGVMESRYA